MLCNEMSDVDQTICQGSASMGACRQLTCQMYSDLYSCQLLYTGQCGLTPMDRKALRKQEIVDML